MYVLVGIAMIVVIMLAVKLCNTKPSEKALEIAEGPWHITQMGLVDACGRMFYIGSGKITLYMDDVLSYYDVMYLQSELCKLYIRMCSRF